VVTALAEAYGIHRVVVLAYHPQGQGLIERGHQPLIVALAKYGGDWVQNLMKALWADQTTVKGTMLIVLRMKQFKRQEMNNEEARERVRRYRLANKEYFNEIKNTRKSELEPGELVLVWDAKKAKDMSRWQKLQPKRQGPFRIKRSSEKGFYKSRTSMALK